MRLPALLPDIVLPDVYYFFVVLYLVMRLWLSSGQWAAALYSVQEGLV